MKVAERGRDGKLFRLNKEKHLQVWQAGLGSPTGSPEMATGILRYLSDLKIYARPRSREG